MSEFGCPRIFGKGLGVGRMFGVNLGRSEENGWDGTGCGWANIG